MHFIFRCYATARKHMGITARFRGTLLGLVRAMRPRRWVKNIVMLVAPFAGGVLFQLPVLGAIGIAFVAFSLASSSVYLVKDVLNIGADRTLPVKLHQPIADGMVPPQLALAAAVALFGTAIGITVLTSVDLTFIILIYIVTQLSYCWWLRHQPVIDICIIASKFLLRTLAGGAAAAIALSQWFLLTMAFGSLFLAAGKRYSEIQIAECAGAKIRKPLERYTVSYLRFVCTLSATGVIMTYSLWTFQFDQIKHSGWSVISLVPFVIAVLRYAWDLERVESDKPMKIALGDRVLQVLGVCHVLTFVATVYL